MKNGAGSNQRRLRLLNVEPQNQGCQVGTRRHRFWALVASSTSMCAPRCTDDRVAASPGASAGGATYETFGTMSHA